MDGGGGGGREVGQGGGRRGGAGGCWILSHKGSHIASHRTRIQHRNPLLAYLRRCSDIGGVTRTYHDRSSVDVHLCRCDKDLP